MWLKSNQKWTKSKIGPFFVLFTFWSYNFVVQRHLPLFDSLLTLACWNILEMAQNYKLTGVMSLRWHLLLVDFICNHTSLQPTHDNHTVDVFILTLLQPKDGHTSNSKEGASEKKWQPFKAKDMRIGTVGCSGTPSSSPNGTFIAVPLETLPILTPSNKHGTNSDDDHQIIAPPISERPRRKVLTKKLK